MSDPGFFNFGLITAFFRHDGTELAPRELFMILVITGRVLFKTWQLFSKAVGIESSTQDFGGQLCMMVQISASVTSVKDESLAVTGGCGGSWK